MRVAEPNRRWASDSTGIRAWDGQKGRLAIMIDCADRMVLAWRFAKRITAEDLAEMLREAVFRRFGEARTRAQGIEFLSDNGRSTPRIGSGHLCEPWGGSLPHAPAEPGVERLGRGVFRQLQAGLRVSSLLRDSGDGGTADPRVDRPLQPAGAAQRFRDAVTGRVLLGLESQKYERTCPKLGGAQQVVEPAYPRQRSYAAALTPLPPRSEER